MEERREGGPHGGPRVNGPMSLPYAGADVPHVLLDILRGCNVRCRACYNTEAARIKPMSEVMAEFEFARSQRRLDCVTLLGGEPLMHPDLLDIARAIRDQGIRVALFTNALDLDLPRARQLKEAGVELVVMHIEAQQGRSDLQNDRPESLSRLRAEKLALLAEAGLDGGISITAMPGQDREVQEVMAFALESPHLSFCLVTLCLETGEIPLLTGDITTGLRALGPVPPDTSDRIGRIAAVMDILNGRMGDPFAVHASIDGDPRWFSHLVATVHRAGRSAHVRPLVPTWMEALLTRLMRLVRGRHFFYQPQRRRLQLLHLLLNGLAGGGLWRSLGVLARTLRPGSALRVKRFLLQVPANLNSDGRLVYCRDCPDAVVRHGRLVPVCISDRVVKPEA